VYGPPVSDGPERACLAIADVSGYTSYLGGVELDHAQDILADLIGTIVEAMAPFQLSKLEGDAAFTYLPGVDVDGSMLQDTIEGTYVAFRSRLRNIQQASSCECNACVRIPSLDLKFVVHHGAIARQRMVGLEELVGSDVILVHRLLKNEIKARLGVGAYVLYTQAVLDAAGIDPQQQSLSEHHEETDVAGDMTGWVRDLEAHWQAELARPRRVIPSESLLGEFSWEVPTPPSVTFEYLTSPRLRPEWVTTITSFDEETSDGRRGIGTTNHCLHGENAIREDIIDWRPPHYWMLRGYAVSIPGEPVMYLSDELQAIDGGGTRVISRAGAPGDGSADPDLTSMVFEEFSRRYLASVERLKVLLYDLAADESGQATAKAPQSSSRYLSDPVTGGTS
jgi:hypothetical protein